MPPILSKKHLTYPTSLLLEHIVRGASSGSEEARADLLPSLPPEFLLTDQTKTIKVHQNLMLVIPSHFC